MYIINIALILLLNFSFSISALASSSDTQNESTNSYPVVIVIGAVAVAIYNLLKFYFKVYKNKDIGFKRKNKETLVFSDEYKNDEDFLNVAKEDYDEEYDSTSNITESFETDDNNNESEGQNNIEEIRKQGTSEKIRLRTKGQYTPNFKYKDNN